jgi:hypothetical protein
VRGHGFLNIRAKLLPGPDRLRRWSAEEDARVVAGAILSLAKTSSDTKADVRGQAAELPQLGEVIRQPVAAEGELD